MSSYAPGRPPAVKDILQLLNGSPQPLGVLTSTGTAVNNATTAVPFAPGAPFPPIGGGILQGTLAGKVLLVNAVAAGSLLPSTVAGIGPPTVMTVALNTTIPPAFNTFPGVPLSATDVRIITMQPNEGWLQWISTTGTASLVVWELL